MKKKRIMSFVILLAMALSLAEGIPPARAEAVSAAESKTPETTEKVLIPEEKYWKYEEKGDGTVSITGFDDREVYTDEDSEREYTYDDDGVGRGITYKLVVPGTLNGKKVTSVGGGGGDFYHSNRIITSIQIPEGVTSILGIGTYTLVTAELPPTVEIIGGYAFWAGNGFPSALKNVNIPDNVKEIEYGAFMECDKLTSIRLPAGLERIGDQAFYGCRSLERVTIPASVTQIDDTAFSDCRSVKAYEVEAGNRDYYAENGILYEKYAGEGDMTKKVMSYPGGKEGEYNLTADTAYSWTAFLNCKGLTAIHVDARHPYYVSVDGVVYQKDMTILQVCPAGKTGEYTVPEGVQSLQSNSFSGSSLHTIHLPDSLEETYQTEWGEDKGFIGGYCFYQCDALQTITIGKGPATELLDCLVDAPNLKNISISGENPYLCAIDNIVYDKEVRQLSFVPAAQTGRLVLPDTVESSASSVGGDGITELVLGKSYKVTQKTWVDDDGEREEYLTGLPRLDALQAYEVSPANPDLAAKDGILYSKDLKLLYDCPSQKKGAIVIPDGTVTIWGEAFERNCEVDEITIPASVTDIRLSIREFSDITIKGYSGSAAEDYVKRANAEGANIKFVSLGTVAAQKSDQTTSSKKTGGQTTVGKGNTPKVRSSEVKKPKKAALKKVRAAGKKKVKVTWKKMTGVSGYQLQFATKRSFAGKKTKNIGKTKSSVTLKKLKKGKTYYIRIRAYNKANGSKKYGTWSSIKKIKVK